MIAEEMVKINYDKDSDALYINFERPLSNSKHEVDTEELTLGIYRVFNENVPSVTYRYVVLDYSYQNKNQLESLIGLKLP
ncbi:DUF2283 domain-containing protein [Staphylococcus saprophyticus]|uniref:DUF2283 domain-containing protein n=1 Tax=Staphylococcus saprophyticus TaxID=29385 RepID=UPI002DBFE403|nr:DUF2283 domain-containing protein [Staphylococcus saprophyticus]MEB7676939.1 DUF2283 domain-containing protein [Staphylococcus saprophyticus]